MSELDRQEAIINMTRAFEWDRWRNEIPYIKFNSEWEVRAIPAFSTGIIRYHMKHNDNFCSIYLDCYDMAGCVGSPYWEVYPYYDDDVFRCGMKHTDQLLKAIKHSLKTGE